MKKRSAFTVILVLLIPAIFSLFFVFTSGAEQGSPYVILTNINENDPYYPAVLALKNYRNATVVPFNNAVNESLPSLKILKPQYAAIAVKPETIDLDFVAQTYLSLAEIDDDIFIDCAVGFITAATSSEMLTLVNNTIRAENSTVPAKYSSIIYSNSTFGGAGGVLNRSQVYSKFFSDSGWTTALFDTSNKTLDRYLKMSSAAFTTIDMHGSATSVEYLGSSEIRNGPQQFLFPTVAIASACYSACTYHCYEEGTAVNYTIDPSQSFSLAFIAKGAVGYVGHLRMAGENWFALEPVLYGMTMLGESQGDALTMSLNYGLSDCITKSLRNQQPINLTQYSIDYLGYILYGDPAYRPLAEPLGPPILNLTQSYNKDELDLNLSVTRNIIFPKFSNGTFIYTDNNAWYQFSGDIYQYGNTAFTLKYRCTLPVYFVAQNVTMKRFNDPPNRIQNASCLQGAFLPVENASGSRYVYIQLSFTFSNSQLQYWPIYNGTEIDIAVMGSTLAPTPTSTPTPAPTSTPSALPTPTSTLSASPSPTQSPAATATPIPLIPEYSIWAILPLFFATTVCLFGFLKRENEKTLSTKTYKTLRKTVSKAEMIQRLIPKPKVLFRSRCIS